MMGCALNKIKPLLQISIVPAMVIPSFGYDISQ